MPLVASRELGTQSKHSKRRAAGHVTRAQLGLYAECVPKSAVTAVTTQVRACSQAVCIAVPCGGSPGCGSWSPESLSGDAFGRCDGPEGVFTPDACLK